MKTRLFVFLIIFLLKTVDVSANLRAPLNISHSPSSNFYHLTNDAEVLQENMTLECDWQFCDVSVDYFVELARPISATVDFIIPKEVTISAKVDKTFVAVQKKSVPFGNDPREKDREIKDFSEKTDGLFKASLPLSVNKGQHQISINYQQPLSQEEVDYGYFSEGYFIGVFQYELWPLNEWKIAADFKFELTVNLKEELLGDWWDSLFSEVNMTCFTVTFTQCEDNETMCRTLKPLNASVASSRLQFQKQLKAPLPDRLVCRISPE